MHIIGYRDEEINRHFSKLKVEDDIRRHSGGTLYDPIRWIDKTFPSREEAKAYIDRNDRNFYDSLAVKYTKQKKSSAKITKLEQDIRDLEKKILEYSKAHSVLTFKAELVGCPHCNSRLNRNQLARYYRSHPDDKELCPLCGTELRGKTTVETLAKYHEKLYAKKAELDTVRKTQGAEVYWLVKYEVNDDHCD